MYMYVHACVTMSTWIVCVCVCVPCSPASWAFSSLPGSAHLTVVDLRRLSCFLLLPWNVSLVQWFQPTVTSSTLKSSVRVPYNSISPFSWNVSWVLYKNGFQVQTNREFRVNKRSADYTAPQPSYAKESLHLHGESPRKHSRKGSTSVFPTESTLRHFTEHLTELEFLRRVSIQLMWHSAYAMLYFYLCVSLHLPYNIWEIPRQE